MDASLLLRELREGRARLESPPSTVNVELTGRCNASPPCAFCVGKNAPGYVGPGHLPAERLERYWPILLRARQVNECSYGEPLLYPGFEAFADRLVAAGVRLGFTTNGLLLDERRARFLAERAERIRFAISVDAGRPETYRWLHGQSLDDLIRRIARFVAIHRRLRPGEPPPLMLSCIVMRSNRREVGRFLRVARHLGVRDVMLRNLFDVRAGDFRVERDGRPFVYEEERLTAAEYREIEAAVRADGEVADLAIHVVWNERQAFMAEHAEAGIALPCFFPWKFLAIRPLHDEYSPCAFLKVGIAAPSRTSVEEVWNGETLVAMRTELAAGRLPEICRRSGVCPLVLELRDARR